MNGQNTPFGRKELLELALYLKQHHFQVKLRIQRHRSWDYNGTHYPESSYLAAFVKGFGIKGAFCEDTPADCYYHINGRIAADNIRCFNKWSDCPLVMKLPLDNGDRKKLVKYLKWLGTDEGFIHSNRFDYLYPDKQMVPRQA